MNITNKNSLYDIRHSALKAIRDAEETGGTKPFFLEAYSDLAKAADYLLLLIDREGRKEIDSYVMNLRKHCPCAPHSVCRELLRQFDLDYPKTLEYMKNNPHLWRFNGMI